MKGRVRDNMKNVAIAILLGILAARAIVWRDTFCMYGGGYLVAQIMFVFLTAYDEILRKRDATMKGGRRK